MKQFGIIKKQKLLYIIIPLLGLLFLVKPAAAGIIIRPVINTGLVGYWSFNEGIGTNVHDMSGNGNHGTWAGSGTHWTDGKFAKGGDFNGSDDYVNIGSSTSLRPANITVSAWVKLNASQTQTLVTITHSASGHAYSLNDGRTSGNLQFNIGTVDTIRVSDTPYIGKWTHMVGVYNGTTAYLYLDGVLVDQESSGAIDYTGSANLCIGGWGSSCENQRPNGNIDEVRIYNRALEASEVRKLYDSGLSKIGMNNLGLVPDDLPSNASISYIRENCTGYSPCYNSLHAWNDAWGGFDFADHSCASGDLTCLDITAVAKIDGTWNSPDTTYVNIVDWVTDATRYIKIYTTASARHNGKRSDDKYRMITSYAGNEFIVNVNYIRIDGLQISKVSPGNDQECMTFYAPGGLDSYNVLSNTMVYDCNPAGAGGGGGIHVRSGTVMMNNVVAMNNGGGYGIWAYADGVSHVYICNSTSVNNRNAGFAVSSNGTLTCKNCYAGGNGINGDYYNGNGGLTLVTSHSSDSSGNTKTPFRVGSGTNFGKITSGQEDLHISMASALKDAGTNLSDEASCSFSTDIDRQARGEKWDIGADEARGTIVNASQTNQITNGLVGYWTFDGKDIDGNEAKDKSENNNTGTISSGGYATPARVNQDTDYTTETDVPLTLSIANATAGNVIVIAMAVAKFGSEATISVDNFDTVNVGELHMVIDESDSPSSYHPEIAILWTTVTANGEVQITFDPSGPAMYKTMAIMEYSGLDTSNPAESYNSDTGDSSGLIYTGNITPTVGSVLVGMTVHSGGSSITKDSNYSEVYYQNNFSGLGGEVCDRVVGAGTYSIPWTLGGEEYWTTIGASFKAKNLGSGPTRTNGKVGQALSFDGGDYVDTLVDDELDGINKLTISAWMKRDDTGIGIQIGRENDAFDDGVNIQFGSNDSYVYFMPANPGYGRIAFNESGWHHLVMVFDGTLSGDENRLKGYIDGEQVTIDFYSPGVAATTETMTNHFLIGFTNDEITNAKGSVDEVRVYNRALEPSEIQRLYNLGR